MTGTPETGQLKKLYCPELPGCGAGVYPNRGDGAEGPWRLGWPELAGQTS